LHILHVLHALLIVHALHIPRIPHALQIPHALLILHILYIVYIMFLSDYITSMSHEQVHAAFKHNSAHKILCAPWEAHKGAIFCIRLMEDRISPLDSRVLILLFNIKYTLEKHI